MSNKEKNNEKVPHQLENIEETLSKTEEFIVNNQKVLTTIVAVLVVLILGFFGFRKYYLEPKNTEAQEQIYPAQRYFEADSLDKALYGDGNSLGFVDIAKSYSITKAGNLANYYAGMAFLKKGNYDQAIEYLKKFSADDELVGPMAEGALGDAYLAKNDPKEAASYYMKAATMKSNDFTSPMFLKKAGEVYVQMGKYDDAISAFEKIKQDYNKSLEAKNIEKYIGQAKELKLNK
ncbi:MAG: tetratricopeptide repeat protein [Bacteroidales bacterium]|nr:tetratricopeptide repeat protein [Bacteroidales bacterium]